MRGAAGEVMGSWRHAMATKMFLKSTPDATDLSAPEPGDDYPTSGACT
ncbi:hypothetical protein [Streptomyces mirabilis]